jgi:hypothetical protein
VKAHECFHCKQWIEEGEAHDCWTTTEAALTRDLSEDLRDAWERLRETAVEFGEQRIYASHHSIMFSRRSCYFFVRPRKSYLEVWIFLGRRVKAAQIARIEGNSSWKACHLVRVRHRDEVEAPITEWLREAYDFGAQPPQRTRTKAKEKSPAAVKSKARVKTSTKTATKTAKPAALSRSEAPRSAAPKKSLRRGRM